MVALAIEGAVDPVQRALVALEAEARRAEVARDPIASILRAQVHAMVAQQHMLSVVDGLIKDAAKRQLDSDQLASAVRDGIRVHAGEAVKALNWRTNFLTGLAAVAIALVGFCGGWLASQNALVAVPELNWPRLKAAEAETWFRIVNLNPGLDASRCERVRASNHAGREACVVWVKPAP